MKFAFLNKLNAKVVAIIAASVVLVAGGTTAIVLAANASRSDNPQISELEAKAAVFSHAGVTEDEVLSLRIDKGSEDGQQVFEIEFKTAEKSYDYDIARSSGEILHASYDVLVKESGQGKDEAAVPSSQGETSSVPAEAPSSSTAAEPSKAPAGESASSAVSKEQAAPFASPASKEPSSSGASSAVTKDEAKSIALKDAGVAEGDAQFVRVEEDYDDGRAVYDVEFYANGTEYDYEIEQSTGRIISSDFDIEHDSPNSGNAGGTVISVDEARGIALAKVPGATENDIRIKLDRDDGYQIYEGEIYYGRMEYEFEIDAVTGNVIEWSAEHWD